ncbi:MAG TPA: peptidase MA family metallohydrolase [Candidatus Sulfomarinibacteraceae bacterium]|nr:peptidase MA family metallohydrolase [Candidatus Sulfomarinibacteraceae bacterium]
MAMRQAPRRVMRLAVVATLVAAGLLGTTSPAAAADPVLSRPAASVRFLSSIAFSGTALLPEPVRRLEIVIDVEGSAASLVADVAGPGASGSIDLRYVLETPGGSLYPNTELRAWFRATLDDGTFIDGPAVTVAYDDGRFAWRSLRGDLVAVHWVEGDAAFGRRALRIGEESVRSAGELFGVTESDPIDFFVYPDEASFYDVIGAGARENVGGTALPEIRTLLAKIEPDRIDDPWVGVVVPHELTHLVFDSATANPYHEPLHWLNEGIADYLARGFDAGYRSAVVGAARSGSLMPLRALIGQFPTAAEQWYLAYAESVSAVDFLVRRYGQPAMVALVRSYADGVTDDEAFLEALGTDTAGFEVAWLDDLGAPAPSPYGPLDAPPGPVPSDWIGEAPVPGAIDGSSGQPGPSPAASPSEAGAPGEPAGPGTDDTTGLLAALVVIGLGLAVLGIWLARQERPASAPPATSGSPELPGDEREPATDEESEPPPGAADGSEAEADDRADDDASPPVERVP